VGAEAERVSRLYRVTSTPTLILDLDINSNFVLTDISGLSSLTSVGENLSLQDNAVLTDISGLSNLTTVGGDLYIYENLALCQSLVDAFVAACSCGTVGNITGNLDGC
jgi:hypothetical protein